jgi:hypothetical protein
MCTAVTIGCLRYLISDNSSVGTPQKLSNKRLLSKANKTKINNPTNIHHDLMLKVFCFLTEVKFLNYRVKYYNNK